MIHTQGPWETLPVHNSEGAFGIYAEAEEAFIATTVDGPKQDANAALIAAAPDMLEALKGCLAIMEDEDLDKVYSGLARIVRDAIAKAERVDQ